MRTAALRSAETYTLSLHDALPILQHARRELDAGLVDLVGADGQPQRGQPVTDGQDPDLARARGDVAQRKPAVGTSAHTDVAPGYGDLGADHRLTGRRRGDRSFHGPGLSGERVGGDRETQREPDIHGETCHRPTPPSFEKTSATSRK